jgi:two-component system cell cycle sensor histidine kinase/response regulator CckA
VTIEGVPAERHGVRPYALACIATAAGVALTRFTWPIFSSTPYAPVFAAVAIATHWGSGRAGLLAIALAAAGAATVFPTGSRAWDPPVIAGFVAVGLIGNRLIAGRNKATVALRQSEAQLRATLEHLRESEETVRRAQKSEAIGQLAAGVAHNFNNLLTITMGYAEVLEDPQVEDDFRRTAIREIRRATDRGATLARQMLAFGRRHDPKVTRVAVDRTLEGVRDMLDRVIREDIGLTIRAGAHAAVLIDPHDLEQAIFNLVLNARDALREGGDITVETSVETIAPGDRRRDPAVAPGEYVCVRVTDNGIGMSPDVRAHLFEPFFTTKEVGEGTGLGLAFVDGVARHAGGFVHVDTEPGRGTTLSVYLPVAAAGSVQENPDASPRSPQQPTATILLVEDEEALRVMTTQMLSRDGYCVLPAATPAEARAIFARQGSEIDLLLTDVVMPEMRGPDLADLLLEHRPELPVLFVSGYSEMERAPGTSAPGRAFLAKPFTIEALTTAITALLLRAP